MVRLTSIKFETFPKLNENQIISNLRETLMTFLNMNAMFPRFYWVEDDYGERLDIFRSPSSI